MKKLFFGILFLTFCTFLSFGQFPIGNAPTPKTVELPGSQNKGPGKLIFTLLDDSNDSPVEYASALLLEATTKKAVDGGLTDEKGKLSLKNIPLGTYEFKITSIGYQMFIQKISITTARSTVNLGIIKLTPESKNLNEVSVTAQKALVEDKVDRIVYNAEKDISNAGGNAGDVLRKVPMLGVDLDGNVSLRGSQNIRVLINGKPSTLMAGNIGDALKQIPAEIIKNVEVITSPSAKYDAEGSAGIINIITKKNTLSGLTGSINLSAGTRGSNLGGNLNYKRGKFGLSAGGFGNLFYAPVGSLVTTTRTVNNTLLSTQQTSDGTLLGGFSNFNLSADYEITPKSTLTFGIKQSLRSMNRDSKQQISNVLNSLFSYQFSNDISQKNSNLGLDFNLDYTKQFKKPNQEMTFLVLYGVNNNNQDYFRDQFITPNPVIYKESNYNNNTNKELTFQWDYTDPIAKNQVLEVGTKAIMRRINSVYSFFNTNNANNLILTEDLSRSDNFQYLQDVWAGYATYQFTTAKKWSFKPGLRLETTSVEGLFKEEAKTVKIPSYTSWIPSVAISKSMKNMGGSIRFGYSRRLQRPSMRFLNPNISQNDPLSISFGNPLLQPEYTDNYEININKFIKTANINLSLYHKSTDGSIETIYLKGDQATINSYLTSHQITIPSTITLNENMILTTYDNVGLSKVIGANVFANIRPNSKMTINASVNGFWNKISSVSFQQTNENYVFEGNLFLQYALGKDWSVQAFGFMRGNQVQLQGKRTGFAFYNFSAKKDFAKKKASITFGLDNPFFDYFSQNNEIISTSPNNVFTQINENRIFNRGIRIGFSYNFGKLDTNSQPSKRKKTIDNNDMKGGDDSGGQGGQTPTGRGRN